MTTLPPISPSAGKLDLGWDHDQDVSTSITTTTNLQQPQPRPYVNGSISSSIVPRTTSPLPIDLDLGPPIAPTMTGLISEKMYDEDLRIKGKTVDEVLQSRSNSGLLGMYEPDTQLNGDHTTRTNDHDEMNGEDKAVIADSQFRPRKSSCHGSSTLEFLADQPGYFAIQLQTNSSTPFIDSLTLNPGIPSCPSPSLTNGIYPRSTAKPTIKPFHSWRERLLRNRNRNARARSSSPRYISKRSGGIRYRS